ncbi:MAG: hypothetical protein M5U14_16625 [Acidimicrobiia bacterium]|nr:hypothetical protein [Acidimicrobiia bacterium]
MLDLFARKVEAAIKSDEWIAHQRGAGTLFDSTDGIDVAYDLASADALPLPDGSVDYVFTDPPFGSNIFYSDMSLFQGGVAGRDDGPGGGGGGRSRRYRVSERTADRYERLLTDALRECRAS